MKRQKSILLTTFLCFAFFVGEAQKANVKEAENWVTSGVVNIPKAKELIMPALEHPETKNLAYTWYVAGLIDFCSFEKEKEKMAFKKSVDEREMYSSLLSAYTYWKKASLLDLTPNKKGKRNPKYLKKIKSRISSNYVFLVNGGVDAYQNKRYEEAFQYFDAYNKIAQNELMVDKVSLTDTNFQKIRIYRAASASLMGNQDLAIKCFEEIKGDTYKPRLVYSQLCAEFEKKGDKKRWEETLLEALEKFPDELDLQKSLINLYVFSNRKEDALKHLTAALKKDPASYQMWNMKGHIYEGAQRMDKAEECYDIALQLNPKNYESLVNMGRLRYNKAIAQNAEINTIRDPKEYKKALKGVDAIYKEALPYFEKAHSVNPQGREALIGLSGVYYKLCDGKKYDEVEKKLLELEDFEEEE